MDAINKLIYETLGWDWVMDYAALLFLITAALALIFILTVIIAAAVGHSRKKKIKYQEEVITKQQTMLANQSADPDAQNDDIARAYEEKYGRTINDLNAANAQKDDLIAELTAELEKADGNRGENNSELNDTVAELNQTNKELRDEINAMRMENASLRNQITAATAAQTQTQERPTRAKKQEPVLSSIEEYADEDDEEEYDNEYGDETSDVKVTLKYDRIKMNWVIYRSDTTRAYRRFATKQEALVIAKDLARRLHAQLVVHKRDGKFQKI